MRPPLHVVVGVGIVGIMLGTLIVIIGVGLDRLMRGVG